MANFAEAPKIEIPGQFAAFQILPKDAEEESDANMPKTAAHAMMVFLNTGINNGANAQKCGQALSTVLKTFEAGPDGNRKVNVGTGILCWNCGHCGLPKNMSDFPADKTDGKMPPLAVCNSCGRNDETNFLHIKQPDGSALPWIDFATMGEGDATPTFAPDFVASTAAPGVNAAAAAQGLDSAQKKE